MRFDELRKQEYIKGLAEGKELGLIEGKELGLIEGEKVASERLNKLGQYLEDAGRVKDLLRSMRDPAYQQQLFEEFGL